MDARDLTINVRISLGALADGPGENPAEVAELVESVVDDLVGSQPLHCGRTTYTVTSVDAEEVD